MPLPELSLLHDRYLALSRMARERFAGRLAGRLLLRCGFDASGVAVAIAASIAGAATLCVDGDAEALRQGLRAGLCDFVVANLDEALRILKNEVRRGLPICVCLTAEPGACVQEMAERGVQPDLLSLDSQEMRSGTQPMLERGAILLPGNDMPEAGTTLLTWSVTGDAARAMPRMATMAAESLDDTRADTPARRRWLELSPRYLGRSFGGRQCLRMTPAEASTFADSVRAAVPAAALEVSGEPATPGA
jgi:hypothetical protein